MIHICNLQIKSVKWLLPQVLLYINSYGQMVVDLTGVRFGLEGL